MSADESLNNLNLRPVFSFNDADDKVRGVRLARIDFGIEGFPRIEYVIRQIDYVLSTINFNFVDKLLESKLRKVFHGSVRNILATSNINRATNAYTCFFSNLENTGERFMTAIVKNVDELINFIKKHTIDIAYEIIYSREQTFKLYLIYEVENSYTVEKRRRNDMYLNNICEDISLIDQMLDYISDDKNKKPRSRGFIIPKPSQHISNTPLPRLF